MKDRFHAFLIQEITNFIHFCEKTAWWMRKLHYMYYLSMIIYLNEYGIYRISIIRWKTISMRQKGRWLIDWLLDCWIDCWIECNTVKPTPETTDGKWPLVLVNRFYNHHIILTIYHLYLETTHPTWPGTS